MPRVARVAVGGEVYHCINRANGRVTSKPHLQPYGKRDT